MTLPALIDKPECQLTGQDGNVFAVIGRVGKALRRAGHPEYASEFTERAMSSSSYDDVLALTFDYVEPL